MQSSLGLSQLSKLEEFIKLKNELYRQYSKNINEKYLKSFNEYETPWFVDLYCNNENQETNYTYIFKKNIETRFSYPSLSSQSYLQNIEKTDLTLSEEIQTLFYGFHHLLIYRKKKLIMFLEQLITFLKIKTIFIK